MGNLAPSSTISILHHLLTDPTVMGLVSWIGFALTFFGLAIAIGQIRSARTAAKAATSAVQRLTRAVHSRERLLELGAANRHLDNAKNHIADRDFATAVIFLQLARGECVLAHELLDNNTDLLADPRKNVRKIVIRITDLITALTIDDADVTQEVTAVNRTLEAREIENMITEISAKLRFNFTEVQTNNG